MSAILTPADAIRLRNEQRGRGEGIGPIRDIPDLELVNTLVAHGQPRWSALELTRNPQLRLAALRFWCDVQDAGKGDPVARQRIDYMRACWSRMRQEELISDDYRRGYTEVFDPKELL